MAGQYEPFLINPPKRLRRRVSKRRYKRNDYQPGMEMADISEMGVGVRPGHTGIKKRGVKRGGKKRHRAALKAWRTRRAHQEGGMAKARRKTVKRRRKASPAQLRALARGRAKRLKNLRGRKTRKRATTKKVARRRTRKYAKRRVAKRTTRTRRTRKTTTRRRRRVSGRRHTIPVYIRKGIARTGPRRHRYGIKSNFRVNPFRRNPFGEELMVIGSNPARRRRRKRKYASNPRRKRGYRAMARGRRRFSRNPLSSFAHLMPMIAAGTAGALATKMVPRVIGVTNTWAVYGTQAVVIVGGGYLADKFMGKSISDGWVIGGATMILSNLVGGVLGGVFAGLGLEYDAFPMGAFPDNGVAGMLGDMQGMGYGAENEFEPSMVY